MNPFKIIFTKTLIFFLLLFLANRTVNAQGGDAPNWNVNINAGTSLFFGDVKQYKLWPVTNNENEWRMGAGLMVSRQFSPVFGVRGQGLYGQLSGTRRASNMFFENSYLEFNINGTVNINNLFGEKRGDRFVNVYLTGGIGIVNYNTYVYTLDTKQQIASVGNGNGKGIGGRTLEGILTGGLGIDFRLNDKMSLNLESANRIMNSDMMDHWVNGFPYDVYNYTSVGLTYRFGVKKSSRGITPSTYKREIPQEQYEVQPKQEQPENVQPPAEEPLPVPVPVEVKKEKPAEVVVPVEPKPEPKKAEPEVAVKETAPAPKEFEYRVQIRARYNRPLSKAYLSSKYNIPQQDIMEDMHNGYYIYTVGSFDTYEQARRERNRLRSYNGVTDAFVVAFKNGERLDKLP